jgi:hypothetical protein
MPSQESEQSHVLGVAILPLFLQISDQILELFQNGAVCAKNILTN